MCTHYNCIDIIGIQSSRTIFTEQQRQMKMLKHPELADDTFIKRVENAIKKPDFIYQDLAEKKRLAYYKHEYSVNGKPRYVKVVIDTGQTPCFVVTAYRPDFVKEKGRTALVYEKNVQ
jgi:hypothetical protein